MAKKTHKLIAYLIMLAVLSAVALGNVLESDIIRNWEFQNDLTDETNNWTLISYGSPQFITTGCLFGTHCLNFSADDQSLETNFFDYTTPHALEFWLYPDSFDDAYMFIFSTNKTNDGIHTQKYSFYYTSTGSAWYNEIENPSDVFKGLNQWQQIVYSYDGTNMAYYVNGVKNYTFADDPEADNALYLFQHSRGAPSRGYYGKINLVRVFSRDLIESEIFSLYNGGTPLTYSDFDTLSISFSAEYPTNNTGMNTATYMNFTLDKVKIEANCTLFLAGTQIDNMFGLSNGTYNFSFNSSYWLVGTNDLNITCNSSTMQTSDIKTLFVDVTSPTIVYNNPANLFIIPSYQNFTINITTNDTNNYIFNFTLKRAGYSDVVYSNDTEGITGELFEFYNPLNLSNNFTGWYKMTTIAVDAHTKKAIDFKKDLISKDYATLFNRGVRVDDVVTYSPRSQISKFETVKGTDRQHFYIEFDNNVEQFEIYLEDDREIKYLGDRYGYQAHFIIADKYWYDLENSENIKVSNVEEQEKGKYKITLDKPKDLKSALFSSMGIINTNTLEQFVYYNKTNVTSPASITKYVNAENVTISLLANVTKIVYFQIPLYTDILTARLSLNSTDANNLTINIGVNDTTMEYESVGNFSNFTTLPNIKSNLQSLLPACDCANCTLNVNNCTVPIMARSFIPTTITFNNLFIGYNYSNSELNITLLDSATYNPIVENMTVEIVGSVWQASNTTTNSNLSFMIPFSSNLADTVTIRAYMTNSTDYGSVSRVMSLMPSTKYNLTIYMTNISDATKYGRYTVRVVDQNLGIRVQNAKVTVIKQNPATGKDLILEERFTDINGEISTYLTFDTVYYKFNVTYNDAILKADSRAYTYPPTKSLITIYVNLYPTFNAYYNVLIDNNANLSFINNTNMSGYYRMDFASNVQNYFCLDVYTLNISVLTLNQSICLNSTKGTLQSNILYGENIVYVALGSVDYMDGNGKRYLVSRRDEIYNTGIQAFGSDGIFIAIIFVLIAWFGFIANPALGLVALIAGMMALYMLKITPLTTTIISTILALAIMTLFVISRRRFQ